MSGNIETFGDNISKTKIQELNDLLMLVKNERLDFIKSDLFIDTVLEASIPSYGIKSILAIKIKDIVLRGELTNSLRDQSDNITSNCIGLLDLNEFNNIELTYNEGKELKIALEQRIKEKNDEFLKDLNDMTDLQSNNLADVISTIKFDTEIEKDILITWQKDLRNLQQVYIKNVLDLGSKIQELVDLKIDVVPKITEQKSMEIELETEKFNLRAKILQCQLHVSIFKELPISMDAYRKALICLKKQQDDCHNDIEIVRNDIAHYKMMLKNEEYHEVLNDYKQYKRSLEKKLYIYNAFLKNKS